jgi:hypothetical protein
MSPRHTRIAVAFGMLLLGLATAASADVLWDQSAISFSPSAPGIINGKFSGFNGGTDYSVNDVSVPAQGWTITTITEYFSDWEGVNMQTKAPTGNLIVMPKVGSMPSGIPTTTTVNLNWVDTVQNGQGVYVMTAAIANLPLSPGDYWITVSYLAPADPFNGNNLQWPALNHSGADVATFNGTTWSNLYPGYDAAFKIEGTLGAATPTARTSWGSLKALYR